MNKAVLIAGVISVILVVDVVVAHQPRIISGSGMIVHIENPEVSQAFYARLDGAPDFYRIDSSVPFRLFVSVLVPDIPDIDKDISFVVSKAGGDEHAVFFVADGAAYNWTRYFEEFGGDYYFRGPEMSADVGEGTYIIKVLSQDNDGKYVLVAGTKEEFPPAEIVNVLITLPRLKSDFFGKSPLTAYFNFVGVFLLIVVVLLGGVSFFVVRRMKISGEKA